MECSDILSNGTNKMRVVLDGIAITRLCQYFGELDKWNRKMNLVAKAPAQDILEIHFLDSLTLLPLLKAGERSVKLLDVGTGAGFPGMVLKIVQPELEVTLVEPRQKRVSFLKHVIRTLGLKGMEIMATRLEKGTTAVAGDKQFPVITSRAFTSIVEFLDLVAPFSPAGGKVICMKGPRADEEIETWKQERPESPFQLSDIQRQNLPFSKATRNLVIFTKTNHS